MTTALMHLALVAIDTLLAAYKSGYYHHNYYSTQANLKKLVVPWLCALVAVVAAYAWEHTQHRDNLVGFRGCGPQSRSFLVITSIVYFVTPTSITLMAFVLSLVVTRRRGDGWETCSKRCLARPNMLALSDNGEQGIPEHAHLSADLDIQDTSSIRTPLMGDEPPRCLSRHSSTRGSSRRKESMQHRSSMLDRHPSLRYSIKSTHGGASRQGSTRSSCRRPHSSPQPKKHTLSEHETLKPKSSWNSAISGISGTDGFPGSSGDGMGRAGSTKRLTPSPSPGSLSDHSQQSSSNLDSVRQALHYAALEQLRQDAQPGKDEPQADDANNPAEQLDLPDPEKKGISPGNKNSPNDDHIHDKGDTEKPLPEESANATNRQPLSTHKDSDKGDTEVQSSAETNPAESNNNPECPPAQSTHPSDETRPKSEGPSNGIGNAVGKNQEPDRKTSPQADSTGLQALDVSKLSNSGQDLSTKSDQGMHLSPNDAYNYSLRYKTKNEKLKSEVFNTKERSRNRLQKHYCPISHTTVAVGVVSSIVLILYMPMFVGILGAAWCDLCGTVFSSLVMLVLDWVFYSSTLFKPIIYFVFYVKHKDCVFSDKEQAK